MDPARSRRSLVRAQRAGLASVQQALHDQVYIFRGLDDRYQFNAFNRKGIDDHLGPPRAALCAEALGILEEAACIARTLQPGQAEIDMQLPIYKPAYADR